MNSFVFGATSLRFSATKLFDTSLLQEPERVSIVTQVHGVSSFSDIVIVVSTLRRRQAIYLHLIAKYRFSGKIVKKYLQTFYGLYMDCFRVLRLMESCQRVFPFLNSHPKNSSDIDKNLLLKKTECY